MFLADEMLVNHQLITECCSTRIRHLKTTTRNLGKSFEILMLARQNLSNSRMLWQVCAVMGLVVEQELREGDSPALPSSNSHIVIREEQRSRRHSTCCASRKEGL